MILHTLSGSPTSAAFKDCHALLRPADALVLLGDGVYAALPDTTACAQLAATGAALYVLAAHAQAAGITEPGSAITGITMDDFVALTERYSRQMAWY
jgi:tRNA 2-thiouridine synthesizing protein B